MGDLLNRLGENLEASTDVTVIFLRGKGEEKQEECETEEGKYDSDILKVELNSDVENGSDASSDIGDNEDDQYMNMNEDFPNLNTNADEISDLEDKDEDDEDQDYKPQTKKRSTAKSPKKENFFQCDQCEYTAAKQLNLNSHMKRMHPGKTFSCSECSEEFGTQTKLRKHFLSQHEVDTLKCEHCDFQGLNSKSLELHQGMKHRDLGYNKTEGIPTCHECGKQFKGASSLWAHTQRIHLENPKYKKPPGIEKKDRTCPVCSETFELTQSQMTMHKQKCQFEKTGEMKYVCEMCGRAFGTVAQVCSHRAQCLGKGKIKRKKCPHDGCEYITRTRTELENHIRQYHLNLPIEKNHICNHCGKAYNLLHQLKMHIKAVHLEIKPFVCPECGKAFARKDKLQDHIDLHKGLFKYKCPFCQKGLNNSGALCNHKRICPSNPDRFASLNEARIARESKGLGLYSKGFA